METAQNEERPKLVIDNDAGGDDAMAIFLALLYEKNFNGPEIVGLITGNGNTNEDNVCINNQRILKIAKRQDVPIFRGSKSALVTTPSTTAYFGEDGLGDGGEGTEGLAPVKDESGVDTLIDLSKKYSGRLTVVTIGTLTNVALAIKIDPGFIGRINHLYVGAGHIHNEKYSTPEFNVHMDVEAYRIVAEHATPDKVTVLPFSQVQEYLDITKDWRLNELGGIQSDIIKAQNIYERVSIPKNDDWSCLDPAVLATVLKPDLVQEYKYSENNILTCGDKRGINTNTFVNKEKANVRIIYSIKKEEYKKFLMDVFSTT